MKKLGIHIYSLTAGTRCNRRKLKKKSSLDYDRSIMSTQDICIRCKEPVRAWQEGLLCDGCERWQHRKCDSGITRDEYRTSVKCGRDVDWRCEDCKNMSAGFLLPVAESTRVTQIGEYISFHSALQSY